MRPTLRATLLIVVGGACGLDRGDALVETGWALGADEACISVAVVFEEPAWEAQGDAIFEALPTDAAVVRPFRHFPVAVVEVTSLDTATALESLDEVAFIDEIAWFEPALDTALPFIGQPAALAQGFDGSGVGIAVVDTGVDLTLPAFGACPYVGAPGCRVTEAVHLPSGTSDSAPGDHGTLVAGAIARTAPGADLVVLDVFEPGRETTTTMELLEALDWVLEHHEEQGIRVVNLALAGVGPRQPTGCAEGTSLGPATRALLRAGIPVVAASGNHHDADGLSAPACHLGAWSVAGVWDERGLGRGTTSWGEPRGPDVLWEGSNTAADIDFGAPAMAVVMMPLGHTGTSIAAAQVSGAAALLYEQDPGMSWLQARHRLDVTGVPVVDGRSGHPLSRIDVAAALACPSPTLSFAHADADPLGDSGSLEVDVPTGCPWAATTYEESHPDLPAEWLVLSATEGLGPATITWQMAPNPAGSRTGVIDVDYEIATISQPVDGPDLTPPTGSLEIADGASFVGSRTLPVVVVASDDTGVAQMCVTTRERCTDWVPWEPTTTVEVRSDGPATVRAWLEDGAGNRAGPFDDTVVVDTRRPTDGLVFAEPGIARVVVAWSGFDDERAGIEGYRIAGRIDEPPPAGCPQPLWEGRWGPVALSALTPGRTHHLRVCGVDRAGNASAGRVVTVVPVGELDPPQGHVEVLQAPWTPDPRITLRLAATDASEVTDACISMDPTECRSWFEMASTRRLRAPSNRSTTLYAWFRDAWGNVSERSAATIGVDTRRPADGTVVVEPLDGGMTLTWAGFEDVPSGIVGYRVVRRADDRPPRMGCTDTVFWEGDQTTMTQHGLTNGAAFDLRLCAVDRAGNASRGVLVTVRPAPEQEPPTGAVVIEGDAEQTASRRVSLALEAHDEAGVSAMCVATTTACTRWEPYTTTSRISLPRGDGERVVRAWFEDAWGNRSAKPATDTILLDDTPPMDGLVSAVGGPAEVTVAWSGFEDATTGVASYVVRWQPERPPATCSAGTEAAVEGSSSVRLIGLAPGGTIGVRVCAVDAVGNRSPGASAIATPTAP